MSVYCHLFRLQLLLMPKNHLAWAFICFLLAFFFNPLLLFCYWIASFLFFVGSMNSFCQYWLVRFPVSRCQIVRSHFLYCLLLDAFLCLAFWLVGQFNPWSLGGNAQNAMLLMMIFGISLFFYGIGLTLSYRRNKLASLFAIAFYLFMLFAIGSQRALSALTLPDTWIYGSLGAALLFYGICCQYSCRYFSKKDVF